MSLLDNLIGSIESGNNPNASLTDYAGNVSVNAQYQQSAGYIASHGGIGGAAAIENQAQTMLASNPNATLGDFYTAYNHGSVLDWSTYSSRFPLQANNFLTNAQSQGFNQNTPLASLLGGSTATGGAGGDPYEDIFGGEDSSLGSDPLGSSVTMNQTVTGSAGSVDFNDIDATDFDGSGGLTGGANTPGYVGSGTIPNGLPGGAAAVAGTGGAPINITDLPGLDTSVTGAGSAIQKGATTAGSDVESAAGGIAGTSAGITNAVTGFFSNALVVVALVILGLVFVAFGLGMFKHNIAAAV